MDHYYSTDPSHKAQGTRHTAHIYTCIRLYTVHKLHFFSRLSVYVLLGFQFTVPGVVREGAGTDDDVNNGRHFHHRHGIVIIMYSTYYSTGRYIKNSKAKKIQGGKFSLGQVPNKFKKKIEFGGDVGIMIYCTLICIHTVPIIIKRLNVYCTALQQLGSIHCSVAVFICT